MAEQKTELSVAEQHIMLAILRQHPNAYGVSIASEIESRTGKKMSLGTIYVALDRLESAGFLNKKEGGATAERGGRKKLFFTIAAPGQRVLSQSLQAMDAMRDGLSAGAFA